MAIDFKVYTDGNREYFLWEAPSGKKMKKDFEFTQSLLDFMDLDMENDFDTFNGMGKIVQELYQQKKDNLVSLRATFDKLALKHIYFQLLRLKWLDKLDDYENERYHGKVYDFMPHKSLTHIPMNIITAQHQIKFMFDRALDSTANPKEPIQKRMAALYKKNTLNADKVFDFRPIPLNFERVDDSAMVEVLHPDSMIDIVDYLMREIIRREISFKVCKSCGKYFPAIAHGNTEFCNRLFQDTGKPCRDIGSLAKWREKVAASHAILLYNKHYKTRFSRIRAGKITREIFQEWAALARDYRDKVMNGEKTLEEFEDWLKSGRWV